VSLEMGPFLYEGLLFIKYIENKKLFSCDITFQAQLLKME